MSKLNPSVGNMYDWVTHTWGCIHGCPHQCDYCYAKKMAERYKREWSSVPQLSKPFPNLDGKPKKVFVCHTSDLFAEEVPDDMIKDVLVHCQMSPANRYVFQTRNPARIVRQGWLYTPHCKNINRAYVYNPIVGCTIETNRNDLAKQHSGAPAPTDRAQAMRNLSQFGFETFVTVEPILDFDVEQFVNLLLFANPATVYIGADSKGCGLEEPTVEKVVELVNELNNRLMLTLSNTVTKLKPNIARIVGEEWYMVNR